MAKINIVATSYGVKITDPQGNTNRIPRASADVSTVGDYIKISSPGYSRTIMIANIGTIGDTVIDAEYEGSVDETADLIMDLINPEPEA